MKWDLKWKTWFSGLHSIKGNFKKIADLSYHFEGEVPNKFSVSEFIFSFGQLLSLLSLVGLGVEVDDAVTIERNINKLKAEITKRKWNTKTVLELLKVTFVERRKAMLKNDARIRVRRALDEYRCLSHQVEVCL